ncbi:peptidoglycan-binding protein [Streptomyces sp. LBL]|uniref:peptidoglycan-binding protein n=1 Tax=Streptomyces sp. LBL TaxID=2940562 RepID=UPI0024748043|nr:peptidoglycan-binding protein [Streptomyces sp. LBL]
MAAPVFEEFDPASDCDCPGCVHWRRVLPHSRAGRHPAAHRAVVLAAAASTTLVVGHTAPALAAPHAPARPGVPAGDAPDTAQSGGTPLRDPVGTPEKPSVGKAEKPSVGKAAKASGRASATTRADIIQRAREWVAAKVPYSMYAYWGDGYRQDCSGFVSMAWNLPGSEWTGSLDQYGVRIERDDLQPGDILLFHNAADAQRGSHVVLFGGWTDSTHTSYIAYEETRPHARRKTTPYAYWNNADRYVAYRYKGLAGGTAGETPDGTGGATQDGTQPGTAEPAITRGDAMAYPGRAYFGPGANNRHVTRLGRMLVERGAGRYYTSGPGPRWSDADRRATRAFQEAQGWRGKDAEGRPGPRTWKLLVTGAGRDITSGADESGAATSGTVMKVTAESGAATSGVTRGTATKGAAGPPAPSSHGVPGYPGRAMFRPGADNEYVTQLGEQLLKKGFGMYYTTDTGPRWGEADRRGVEAFQRAQGWRGGAADGYPGPETWRRLFS